MENEVERSLSEVTSRSAGTSRDAVNWFSDKLKHLAGWETHPTKDGTEREIPDVSSFLSKKMGARSVGRMMMFAYDAKTKDRLPYWDALPLVLLVEYTKDGFTGLNLHYVPPLVRKRIIDSLIPNLNPDPVNLTSLTRGELRSARINYGILKDSARYDVLKPCFKKYLFRQVRSSFLYIDPSEWDKAIMLPTERFQKATKGKVFRESMASAGRPLPTDKPIQSIKPTSLQAQKPTSVKTTSFFDPPEKK